MLDACASGYYTVIKQHRRWIYYKGEIFRDFPLGVHGSHNPEIFVGKVRHLVNFFGLDPACVNRFFPGLVDKV